MEGKADVVTPLLIFLVLLGLVGWAALGWRIHESRRPLPVEVRIVSATSADPVFREGPRHLGFDEELKLALAIRLEYPTKGSRWLAPVGELEIDGERVDVLSSPVWPEEDRFIRAFWFTLESPFLGGVLESAEDAEKKLALRPFLAPEMGQGLLAGREPEWHAEDDVDLGENLAPAQVGCYRLYARIQLLDRPGSTHPLVSLNSIGADHVDDSRMLEMTRDLPEDFGLDPGCGRLFRLPGFEARDGSGLDPSVWASELRAASSRSFAAAAAGWMPDDGFRETPLRFSKGIFLRRSRRLRWGRDLRARDLLRQGMHWMVLLRDDGDGVLGSGDVVAQSWKRPPAVLHLETVFDPTEGPVFLVPNPQRLEESPTGQRNASGS